MGQHVLPSGWHNTRTGQKPLSNRVCAWDPYGLQGWRLRNRVMHERTLRHRALSGWRFSQMELEGTAQKGATAEAALARLDLGHLWNLSHRARCESSAITTAGRVYQHETYITQKYALLYRLFSFEIDNLMTMVFNLLWSLHKPHPVPLASPPSCP